MVVIPKLSKIGRVYIDDNDMMFRIIDSTEKNYIAVDEGGVLFECNDRQLKQSYNLNIPSGIMSINLVDIGFGNQDVIVTFYRTIDLSNGKDRPFIAGRQSIINFLAAQLTTDLESIPYGLCISRVSCPIDFDMDIMLECNQVLETKIISLYPFDTITSIQKLLKNTTMFDSVINNFRVNFDPKGTKTVGTTLYQFLDNTGWQVEFNTSHGIVILNDDVFKYDKTHRLLYPQKDRSANYDLTKLTTILEHHLSHRVNVLDAVEYNPRHDLSKLGNNAFILVRNYDDSNNVFIVKYMLGDPVIFVPKSQKLIASQLMSKLGLQL